MGDPCVFNTLKEELSNVSVDPEHHGEHRKPSKITPGHCYKSSTSTVLNLGDLVRSDVASFDVSGLDVTYFLDTEIHIYGFSLFFFF